MRFVATFALLSLVTPTMLFAQSSRQVGAWSVYTSTGNFTRSNVVMLQTTAVGTHQDAMGDTVPAKLDIICKHDKVVAVALEAGSNVDKRYVNYSGAVPTARVVFAVEGRVAVSENWAISDGGRTLSPYSELSQGKLNRTWVKRINGTDHLEFQVNQSEGDTSLTPTFVTENLTEALSAAGCKE